MPKGAEYEQVEEIYIDGERWIVGRLKNSSGTGLYPPLARRRPMSSRWESMTEAELKAAKAPKEAPRDDGFEPAGVYGEPTSDSRGPKRRAW